MKYVESKEGCVSFTKYYDEYYTLHILYTSIFMYRLYEFCGFLHF